mmetsp:Transcript_38875/g.103728  ORF Transcript_38875/g.103728 Transcript_38875/m.103728 type:complete len:90 (+) Transcript_38875:404-673(+)
MPPRNISDHDISEASGCLPCCIAIHMMLKSQQVTNIITKKLATSTGQTEGVSHKYRAHTLSNLKLNIDPQHLQSQMSVGRANAPVVLLS